MRTRTNNQETATITRTNALKKLVQTKLKTVATNVFHEVADDNALYPHVVFGFRRIDLGDLSRQDYILDVDVWDKGNSTTQVDALADTIENLLQGQNLPQDHVLPTFYLINRTDIPDDDVAIKHRRIQFQIQNYER